MKASQGISYKEIAEHLGIKQDSMYHWLKNHYDLSQEKERKLIHILDVLMEG